MIENDIVLELVYICCTYYLAGNILRVIIELLKRSSRFLGRKNKTWPKLLRENADRILGTIRPTRIWNSMLNMKCDVYMYLVHIAALTHSQTPGYYKLASVYQAV